MSPVTEAQTEALERVLAELLAEHETLIELADRHRAALRSADGPAIAQIAAERAEVNDRIASLDAERAELVSAIAEGVGMTGAGVTVRAIVARLSAPASDRLRELAERLRGLIEQARIEHAALGEATAAIAGHLGGVLAQVVRACSTGATYTASGTSAVGPAVPASLDLKH